MTSRECLRSSRIAANCNVCGCWPTIVHSPLHLRGLFCEQHCPVCTGMAPRANAGRAPLLALVFLVLVALALLVCVASVRCSPTVSTMPVYITMHDPMPDQPPGGPARAQRGPDGQRGEVGRRAGGAGLGP